MLTKVKTGADKQRPIGLSIDELEPGRLVLALEGIWTTGTVALIDAEMREVESRPGILAMTIDLQAVKKMDTAGAWLVQRLVTAQRQMGNEARLIGQTSVMTTLLEAVSDVADEAGEPAGRTGRSLLVLALERIGRLVVDFYQEFLMGMHILGATIRGAQMKAGRRPTLRPAAVVSQMERMGVGALPVVLLMSAIIGAIIAQQGAFQLRYFGAEIFVVDLVAILVLREIGVLLTAIMIAGRSGSAITAEIGSMKMREEVDALKVIGLNPVGVLVFPRLVALVIMLPCLTIAANAAALAGAIAVAWVYSDIPPVAFIERMHIGIDLTTIFAGLIKAPFMAIIIGIIASIEGLKTGGSAESLGQHVTASVVKSIFIVILVDGLFAMFYAAIDF